MYSLRLEIPEAPPSLNKSLRTYRHQRDKINKHWYNLLWYLTSGKRPPRPLRKAKIKITRHFYRTLDYDGLVGSLKPVVDGLTHAGIIIDDKWSVVGAWEVDQVFRPKSGGVRLVIEVTELPEDS